MRWVNHLELNQLYSWVGQMQAGLEIEGVVQFLAKTSMPGAFFGRLKAGQGVAISRRDSRRN